MVTAYINGADRQGTKTFAEILAPIWQGWRKSGMTDSEVDDLFEQQLHEARSERRQSQEPP